MNTPENHPPFTPEMLAADYVLLGRGGTFEIPKGGTDIACYRNGKWHYVNVIYHTAKGFTYAAPRSSEVARINGLGLTDHEIELMNDPIMRPTVSDTSMEIAQLRDENEALKSSAAIDAQVHKQIFDANTKLDDENKKLRDENERLKIDRAKYKSLMKALLASARRHREANRELREAMSRCKDIAIYRIAHTSAWGAPDTVKAMKEIESIARETLAKHKPCSR